MLIREIFYFFLSCSGCLANGSGNGLKDALTKRTGLIFFYYYLYSGSQPPQLFVCLLKCWADLSNGQVEKHPRTRLCYDSYLIPLFVCFY